MVEVQVVAAVGEAAREAAAREVEVQAAEPAEEGQAEVDAAGPVGQVEVPEVEGAGLEERVEERAEVAAENRPIRISTIPRMASLGP